MIFLSTMSQFPTITERIPKLQLEICKVAFHHLEVHMLDMDGIEMFVDGRMDDKYDRTYLKLLGRTFDVNHKAVKDLNTLNDFLRKVKKAMKTMRKQLS